MRDLKKVYLIKKDIDGRATMGVTNPMVEAFLEKVFIHVGESYTGGRLNPEMPVMKFGAKELTLSLLDRGLVQERQLYSPPDRISRASSKKGIYWLMRREHMPRTVFNRTAAALDLNYPVIVKPINGWAGKHMFVANTFSEIPSLHGRAYQEHIKIEHEYRYTMVKQNVIFVAERIPSNEKAKALRDGLPRQDLEATRNKFIWKPKHRGLDAGLLSIAQKVMFRSGLGYAGVDLAVAQDGQKYLIEVNTSPGMTHNQSVLLYENIFQDWYGLPVEPETKQTLDLFGEILEEARKRYVASNYSPSH